MVECNDTREGHVFTFTMASDGEEAVYLVGDFNNWSTTATPMEPGRGGRWQARLRLQPGSYRFGYFILQPNRWGRLRAADACEGRQGIGGRIASPAEAAEAAGGRSSYDGAPTAFQGDAR